MYPSNLLNRSCINLNFHTLHYLPIQYYINLILYYKETKFQLMFLQLLHMLFLKYKITN